MKGEKMKRIFVLVLAVLTLGLSACSDSDDGGTSGGFGTIEPETRALCYNVTGGRSWTEPLGNGASMTFNSDCSFTIRTTDGNGHGRFNEISADKIQLEATVTSGRYAGCGYQGVATHRNGYITSIDMWSNDDARCMQ